MPAPRVGMPASASARLQPAEGGEGSVFRGAARPPQGAFTQHGDLATEILWHASQHNGPSFGVEVVNPYYPSYLKPGLPWDRVIKAPWAHKGEYVLPTPAQA